MHPSRLAPLAVLASLAFVASCTESGPATPARAQGPVGPAPEAEVMPDGSCQAREVTPAVYEHVMGEVQVVQAEIAEDGTVIRPPIYRRAPVPRVVQPRTELRFEAPCPDQMTPEFIASVQRALTARGYFSGRFTGMIDTPTNEAILRYQTERGLRSSQLSLETARALGLIAVERTP